MRDKSVVRSSVIPSAKYCCSGSLLRLANGNTTIDSRGATRGAAIDIEAATAGVGERFVVGQNQKALVAIISATAAAAPIAAGVMGLWRGAAISVLDAGSSATASGRSA